MFHIVIRLIDFLIQSFSFLCLKPDSFQHEVPLNSFKQCKFVGVLGFFESHRFNITITHSQVGFTFFQEANAALSRAQDDMVDLKLALICTRLEQFFIKFLRFRFFASHRAPRDCHINALQDILLSFSSALAFGKHKVCTWVAI